MTQLWKAGEPIVVTVDDSGTPTHFVWEEQRHTVYQILQQWELETDWWQSTSIRRQCFAIFTDRKLFCVIYHDLLRSEWRLLRLYD